ncbi:MAG TPA: Uma2 family endonuclease [Fimbriimonas sp.]|nr:Uma2 family endonuclease [Fimbriimonas sp.]
MAAPAYNLLSAEEYLAIERASDTKHEYVDGRVYAMAGTSLAHALIANNIAGSLWTKLSGSGCNAVTNDLRVSADSEAYFYPDVVVFCKGGKWRDEGMDTLESPVVVFEVLSDSTEVRDRSVKFERYQKAESLQMYVLVAQDHVSVEVFRRASAELWEYFALRDLNDVLSLEAVGAALPVSEVYRDVEFSSGTS